jgi:sugar lactone lactonase YvrE
MKKVALGLGMLLLALMAYLALWPVPIQPVSWKAPAASGYVGPHAANQKLAGLKMIDLGGEEGPEHVVLARDGKLYTTVLSGNILRMNPDGSGREVFANTGGRVLGFDFDAAGNLIAADAVKGLLSIGPDRKITVLTDQVGGDPIRYADAVVVARNGKIYLSDASTRFAPARWGGTFEASVLDIIEQSSTGRILEYDPATRGTRVVAKGLSFANGVALSQDEKDLFVAETGKYRVWKIPAEARELDIAQGGAQARLLLDNLPGYPDNLMRGMDGKILPPFQVRRPRLLGQRHDLGDVLVGVDAVGAGDGRQLHAVLEAQLVDLLDLFPLGVAADGEDLEAAFQRQHDGLGQAGVDHVGRQADALDALDLGRQFDLARLDHQHVGRLATSSAAGPAGAPRR